MEQQPQQKRTAVQRIEDLEHAMMDTFQKVDSVLGLARDTQIMRDAIKLLGNKIDAIVKATTNGEGLSDDVISRIMVENNVTDLKGKVSQLVTTGTLVPAEGPLDETNLVVGQEVDDTGKVLNPRLQFVLGSLRPDLQTKIKGAKVGDSISFKEGKLLFQIQEAYSVVAPKPPQAAPEAAPSAETAPAAEQSSTDDANTLPVEQSSQSSGS